MSDVHLSHSSNGHLNLEEGSPSAEAEVSGEGSTEIRPSEAIPTTVEPELVDDPLLFVYLAIGAALTVTTGVLAGTPNLLAISNALVPFAVFVLAVRRGRLFRATQYILFWFVWQTAAAISLSLVLPARAEAVFAGGFEQRISLVQWISTGRGDPSNPAIYLPQHLAELAAWVLGCLLTGGAASLYALVLRVNDLSFAIAGLLTSLSLLRAAFVAFLGWPLWNLVRIGGLATLAPPLAEPLLRWDIRSLAYRRRQIALGLGLVVLGSLLELLLASIWPSLLQGMMGI